MRNDIRYAIRSLTKSPTFTLLAVLALALGIGANTAIFSVVNGVLLRSLPYANPGRLVTILHFGNDPVSPDDYLDWRRQSGSFAQMGAAQVWGGTLTGLDHAEAVPGLEVSANMFDLLGIPALRGRTFVDGEDQRARSRIVVLSYGLWQRRFGGDPAAVGRAIAINGEAYTVVGVMPPSFQFAPYWATNAELWVPLVLDKRLNDRGGRSLRIFARLRDGVPLKQAQADINVICRRLEQQYPMTNKGMTADVIPLQEKVVANIRPTLLVLLGTVGFVLLIACTNVANLMLVRANGKKKETAVRLALGSTRLRLIRQSMVESLLLSVGGAVSGGLIASWGIKGLLNSLPPASLPRLQEVTLDKTVLVFTVLIAVATGVLCAIAPAFHSLRADLQEALAASSRGYTTGRSENRMRSLLVASEIALALILLVGAGLMMRSFRNLAAVDPGFDARNVLTFEVAAGGRAYRIGTQRVQFFERLRPRLEALPGVRSVSLINHLPVSGDVWHLGLTIFGRPAPPPGEQPTAAYRAVQPGYFATMRIPMLAGRDFSAHDLRDSALVGIVNESLAKRHWPKEDPIGQRLSIEAGWITVVGVVKDVKQSDWVAAPEDELYVPHTQTGMNFGYMTVVMRTQGDPMALAKPAEEAVRSLDKDVPIAHVATMEQTIHDKLWRGRLAMNLLGLFSLVALTLAALGVYGAISYSISQRTHEMWIRMALGAQRSDLMRMIVGQGTAVVAGGLVVGLIGAWALSRTAATLLYGVTATDPVTFVLVPAVLGVIGIAASWIPALKIR